MTRRNKNLVRFAIALPVLALVLVDARRRPELATMAYGATLFATSGWTLAANPAFAPRVPGLGDAVAALALTLAAGAVGGHFARRLSLALARSSASRPAPAD